MSREFTHPFSPKSISEIIDPNELSVIEAGCSARFGRALTIIDINQIDQTILKRIEALNIRQKFGPICRMFRDNSINDVGNAICIEYDQKEAKKSYEIFLKSGMLFRKFPCHLGLIDMTYIILVAKNPVALVYTGQYRSSETKNYLTNKFENEGYSNLFSDPDTYKKMCKALSEHPMIPDDAEEQLEIEVKLIQDIAQDRYNQLKNKSEQFLIDKINSITLNSRCENLSELDTILSSALGEVCKYFNCESLSCFGSLQAEDTVLAPISKYGFSKINLSEFPHFNWKKAKLSLTEFDEYHIDIDDISCVNSGIRGPNSEALRNASCIVPVTLSSKYRFVILFGTFNRYPNISENRGLLITIARIIGLYTLNCLGIMDLQNERTRWETTANGLSHQIGTAFTPIINYIDLSKIELSANRYDTEEIIDYLNQAKRLAFILNTVSKGMIRGDILELEKSDLVYQKCSLSVLINNCANGFNEKASKNKIRIVLDKSIDMLPSADIDIARLTLAFANLFDNAVKYSYPNTTILIKSNLDLDRETRNETAYIKMINLGNEIKQYELRKIFELGFRSKVVKENSIASGSGFGLAEVYAVIKAHQGDIVATCTPTKYRSYRTVIKITLPLRKKD